MKITYEFFIPVGIHGFLKLKNKIKRVNLLKDTTERGKIAITKRRTVQELKVPSENIFQSKSKMQRVRLP